jgi:excisionase family DNA binding protein
MRLDDIQSDVISIEEAAQVLRISRGSAYEAARVGQIPAVRIGRRLVVPVRALRVLLGAEPPQ